MGNLRFLIVFLVIHVSVAPPVTKDETKENEIPEDKELQLEYERYMTQVVSLLETDPVFKAKLENATKDEILSGKIADHLEYVNHTIRTQLDELKRIELDRLNHLYLKMKHEEEGLDFAHLKIGEIKDHVDHENAHTFEIRDLKKLINKVTKDLEEVDKKRREKFKEYEMEKQFEQEEKKKQMNEEDKKKYEHEIDEMKKKHKEHEPLNQPGSKKQLEEVWEKQDHMEQEFDPRTFFYLHDLNGDGVWDQNELKALFLKELDKLYAEGRPEDDFMERAEELERMREHVLREADVNRDGFISYQEFVDQTKKSEFDSNRQWESLDQQQIYSEQEYENYRRRKEMELQEAISRGMSPDHHPGGQPLPGHQQFPPHPNNVPYQQPQYQQQQQYANQQYNHQYPQQGQHQQPIQQQGQFAAPVPQQQNYHANQQPVGQGVPQQQYQQPPPVQNTNFNSQQNQQQQQQQYNQQPVQNTNQQQFQQPPVANQGSQQQQPPQQQQYQQQQQQYQQQQYQPNLNQPPQQQNLQQQNQLNTNQIPQHANQQPLNTNNVNQAQQQNQPNPAVQSNNHVSDQAHGQIASLNNAAQTH